MVSIRPLRVEELAEILAVRFYKKELPTFNPSWRPENAEEAVISACSSLVAIVNREGSQVVQFSHFSVKEFLTSERLAATEHLSYYHILPEPAHTVLAHAALSVLLQLDDKIDKSTIDSYPFTLYAARYWTKHAQFRNVSSHIQEIMKGLFDGAKPHFAAWVWLHDVDRDWAKPISKLHPTRPEAVPLYYAALCGFRALVEHLIAADSRGVNSRGGFHTTPLHAASVKGHSDVASLLLENGADPDSRDELDSTPLHKVSQGGQLLKVESSLEIARLLVNSGADVNATDYEGATPLHAAAQSGYCDIVELLLESGARLDSRNKRQYTPLFSACLSGRVDLLDILINRGSDVHSCAENDSTPLHFASLGGHLDATRLLLDCGSDVDAQSSNGFTSLHSASHNGHLDIAKFLVDRGANEDAVDEKMATPLALAAMYGHLDIAHFLIESGAAASIWNDDGHTPFHVASYRGHLHIVKFLLECGIDIDIRGRNEETSLYLASENGKLDIVHFLIERGADIHASNNGSWNSIHIASQNGAPRRRANVNRLWHCRRCSDRDSRDPIGFGVDQRESGSRALPPRARCRH